MQILIDTHIFLWALSNPERLSKNISCLLESEGTELYLSTASIWEICIKASLKKLPLPEAADIYIESRMADLGILSLPIKRRHAYAVYSLPYHHQDPFDRIIIAQGQTEEISIISADARFKLYDVNLIF